MPSVGGHLTGYLVEPPPLLAGAAHEASAPVAILSHAPPPSVGGYFFPPLFTQASFAETPPQRARGGLCFRPWVYLLPSVWPPPVFAGRARYCVPYKFKDPPLLRRAKFSPPFGVLLHYAIFRDPPLSPTPQ